MYVVLMQLKSGNENRYMEGFVKLRLAILKYGYYELFA